MQTRPAFMVRAFFLSSLENNLKKVSFFIDGFNVYHSLKSERRFHKYLWLDYTKLMKNFIQEGEELGDIFYFTAYAYWRDGESLQRHKNYVAILEKLGVKPVFGEFKKKEKYCKICQKNHIGYEEKQSDVNLSVGLLVEAVKNTYEKAIIVTADSDITPAVKAVKSLFPEKKIGVLFPIDRNSNELREACDFALSTYKLTLRNSQLPDKIEISPKIIIKRPERYK
jgi:uncharacterized LabA/DUF88 family protein